MVGMKTIMRGWKIMPSLVAVFLLASCDTVSDTAPDSASDTVSTTITSGILADLFGAGNRRKGSGGRGPRGFRRVVDVEMRRPRISRNAGACDPLRRGSDPGAIEVFLRPGATG